MNSSQLGQKDYNETAIGVGGNYETATVHKRYPVNANDAKIQGRNSTSLKEKQEKYKGWECERDVSDNNQQQ